MEDAKPKLFVSSSVSHRSQSDQQQHLSVSPPSSKFFLFNVKVKKLEKQSSIEAKFSDPCSKIFMSCDKRQAIRRFQGRLIKL